MTDAVKIEQQGPQLTITLNRPDNGNLISKEMASAIQAALLDLSPETRVVFLKANGPDFCRGREAGIMPAPGKAVPSIELRRNLATPVLEFYAAFRKCAAPIVGIVQGRAAGVGCALAALCDITIAADDAIFQVPEMERDLPPSLVMTALTRRATPKTIARLVLTCDPISATEASARGIVDIVVPKAKLDDEARRVLGKFDKYSVASARTVKEFLRLSLEMSASALDEAAGGLQSVGLSPKYAGG
jgi:enoyl-CoA hydratase/carnithine racemase